MQAQVAGRSLIMVLLDSAGKYSRIGDAERLRKWLITSAAPLMPVMSVVPVVASVPSVPAVAVVPSVPIGLLMPLLPVADAAVQPR